MKKKDVMDKINITNKPSDRRGRAIVNDRQYSSRANNIVYFRES
jgi:hypothetical protein